jgi:hypothetical protein
LRRRLEEAEVDFHSNPEVHHDRYSAVLKQFADFVVSGKVPHDAKD